MLLKQQFLAMIKERMHKSNNLIFELLLAVNVNMVTSLAPVDTIIRCTGKYIPELKTGRQQLELYF
jgi:hypothetical protein